MTKKVLKFLFLFIIAFQANIAQRGNITGKVVDRVSKEPLIGVNVIVIGTDFGAATDIQGYFEIRNIPIGTYQVRASFIGYEPGIRTDVVVNSAMSAMIDFDLLQSAVELDYVVVEADYFDINTTEVISVTSFGYEEIRRSPGGFEDVIRALSILPGISQVSAGRNDLIVRGGAPSENLFIVDGFVVPNINHFGTQGATGGPLSFINLDFVSNTTFSTGGFSSIYGDKLSSVLELSLREGRKDKLGGKATISATQFGLNLEGPISDNQRFFFSARRSYLDFIFDAAGFNFVPEYWDVIAKYNYNFNTTNKLSFLFISAFDRVKFNNNSKEDIEDNSRILGTNQNQYLAGLSYQHLIKDGFYTISLSRNFVDYDSFQKDTLFNPIFTNKSREQENELKFDLVYKLDRTSELNLGASGKYIKFNADVFFPPYTTTFGETLEVNELSSAKKYYKASVYSQYSKMCCNDNIRFNFGLRLDYFNAIEEKIYFSPRFSTAYYLTDLTTLNFAIGIYHQFPSYIWLQANEANKNLKAIRVNQYIVGIDQRLRKDVRAKLEFYYKDYHNYPTSVLRPYIVLANTGAGYTGTNDNFATFGLEQLVSSGIGYSNGIEFSVQKKSSDIPHYALFSLTYNVSKFTGLDEIERYSLYDQRWIVNLVFGYVFDKNWETSFKFRLATGNPYTPFNNDGTQSVEKYNTERFDALHSLDVRVDKRWDFNGWSLITYLDIQNIYNNKYSNNLRWDREKQIAENESSIGILPSIGVSLMF
ncbi:MAG: TonB-dependent receptor [Ignavibacteriales bacterium]|nr:TonB-dependent receptor [Ignavibacteriales bacterium]